MNTVYNLGSRKRFSFLIFTVFVTVAMFFATAPAATAQVLTPSFNGGLDFDDNDIVCFFVDTDSDRIRCFRVGERDDNGPLSQQFSERRIRSGAASPSVNIANSGNNVNL